MQSVITLQNVYIIIVPFIKIFDLYFDYLPISYGGFEIYT